MPLTSQHAKRTLARHEKHGLALAVVVTHKRHATDDVEHAPCRVGGCKRSQSGWLSVSSAWGRDAQHVPCIGQGELTNRQVEEPLGGRGQAALARLQRRGIAAAPMAAQANGSPSHAPFQQPNQPHNKERLRAPETENQ